MIIAAPLGAHFQLATIALTAGADVYLEKPPVASLDDFQVSSSPPAADRTVVQVGFQSLGSRALEMLTEDALGIGRLVKVSAVGPWSRTVGYWTRSPWAGRRSLGGQPVVDGVATNALAHAVVTALAIVGCRRLDDVESVETDLYRANAIDSDDTSVVRIRTDPGIPGDLRPHTVCTHRACSRRCTSKERSAVPPSATPLIGWRSRPRIGAARKPLRALICSRTYWPTVVRNAAARAADQYRSVHAGAWRHRCS